MRQLILLALLAFLCGFDGFAFGEQRGVGDLLTHLWRCARLALVQCAQLFYQQAAQTWLIVC